MEFSPLYNQNTISPETVAERSFYRFHHEMPDYGRDISILKYISSENLRSALLISDNSPENRVVGIKFDNISAGKYSVPAYSTQRRVTENNVNFLDNQAATLQNDDFLVRALECNEPAVLCQSTFL